MLSSGTTIYWVFFKNQKHFFQTFCFHLFDITPFGPLCSNKSCLPADTFTAFEILWEVYEAPWDSKNLEHLPSAKQSTMGHQSASLFRGLPLPLHYFLEQMKELELWVNIQWTAEKIHHWPVKCVKGLTFFLKLL